MAAPVTCGSSLPQDLQQTNDQTHNPASADTNLTISQLSKFKISRRPFKSSLGKRRKSRPVKYRLSQTAEKKKSSPLNLQIVLHDPSSNCLSSPKGNSATKELKSLAENGPAMLRAREVQSSLGTEHPSCIKLVVRVHITSARYWMGLPQIFCRQHLPQTDTVIVVEDENGKPYDVKYIAYKTGLSAGWRKFAMEHNLVEGDVVVFHLVEPCKLKVYIIRVNDMNDVDGALSLLNLEAHTKQITPDNIGMATPSPKRKKNKRPKSLPLAEVVKKQKRLAPPSEPVVLPEVNAQQLIEPTGNESEEIGSEVLEGSRPSKHGLSFHDVKAFGDFSIVVHGRCINSELPEDVRKNYYLLCQAKKEFLHDCIPESMYCKLVVGMIFETVSIANHLKNCKVHTSEEKLKAWDNSLKSFQLLGMKVGFLRDRVKVLLELLESEDALYVRRYAEAKSEQKHVADQIKEVEEKLMGLKEESRMLEGTINDLKQKAEDYKLIFEQRVGAPW